MIGKTELRAAARAGREAFAPGDEAKNALSAILVAAIGKACCVAGYWPMAGEADPLPAIAEAAAAGARTALPLVADRVSPMRFIAWKPGDPVVTGWAGLRRPTSGEEVVPDLVLTPLLAFDRRLQRLGQGAGFYDRWFAEHPGVRRVGVAWSVQEVAEVAVDGWDIPLDAVATELELIGATS